MTPLTDYTESPFTHEPWTRPVFHRGAGPAVIIMHEMPGLHPLVLRFADRVAEAGHTVYLPSLFGTPEQPISRRYLGREIFKAVCIRREFSVWATNRSSPIVDWLRALARQAHADCGGAGVGAIGMCFTGGFALAMMTEPSVIAPVLSQPSLPLAIGFGRRRRARAVDASAAEIRCVKDRLDTEDRTVLGLRFSGDPLVPAERFDFLSEQFGERFEGTTLADSAAPADAPGAPHSVLTVHLDDSDPAGPTRQLEQRVIRYFNETLHQQPEQDP